MNSENRTFPKFWSYLWGIEILIATSDYHRYRRFDLTYEGLKYVNMTTSFTMWTSFDLTYEGLKSLHYPFFNVLKETFWSYLWGIETKFHKQNFSFHFRVLILPMRDWNIIIIFSLILKTIVLILPMRDWNEDFGIFIAGELAVLILPMRNCWLKAWFFVLYHSQLYKSPDKIPFIYFLKFFAFFPHFSSLFM